ncbi:hypothetical protein F7725_012490 [Dissostichus mawsoni]|uniref:Uncharacterized protein n=1 Tax=Dissostichus mawsoni TaxID=36200 RepID=A0A7J5YR11_DISMA|nr:hypothetical protein F7725_012490 [Dissostichus mawsoni]
MPLNNGMLVMDMCCGDDGEVIGDFTLENLRRGAGEEMDKFYNSLCRNLPRRYVLPLTVDKETPMDQNLVTGYKATAKKVYMTHEELYDDELLQYGGLEFPQINYDEYNGKPYRYFYSCGFGHCFREKHFPAHSDAKTFTELGRAEVPVNIPYGSHGVFNLKG